MQNNTEQTLSAAISELNYLRPGTPAALDELTALRIARECIDELLRSCVTELRADPRAAQSWPSIAYALGSSSAAVQQHYGSGIAEVGVGANVNLYANAKVMLFWQAFAERFAWDFLPTSFLHALYTTWMTDHFPEAPPLPEKTFTRRLRVAATPPDATGEWFYIRCRPGSLMNAAEPLVSRVPHWAPIDLEKAQYGLRRSGS